MVLLIPSQIGESGWNDIFNMSSAVFFPALVGILMILLGLAHFLVVHKKTVSRVEKIKDRKCYYSLLFLLISYPFSVYFLGMTISSAFLVFFGAIIFEFRNWQIIILSSIISPLAIHILFVKTLRILLPEGAFF